MVHPALSRSRSKVSARAASSPGVPPWQDRNSQGTQGMVEAERTEGLKVANLSTSEYGVAL